MFLSARITPITPTLKSETILPRFLLQPDICLANSLLLASFHRCQKSYFATKSINQNDDDDKINGNRKTSLPPPLPLHPRHRVHLLFGANTDVGKSIVSSGLLGAASLAAKRDSTISQTKLNYIKPLQCGGSDESFVYSHNTNNSEKVFVAENNNGKPGDGLMKGHTLFTWQTPASPHLASRLENYPVSDDEVLSSLRKCWNQIVIDAEEGEKKSTTIIETAGGVLSPSSSSPLNHQTNRSLSSSGSRSGMPNSTPKWKWSTQADLYSSLQLPVVFVGDPKLGGISVTLASLEALWSRGYHVDAVVFIEAAKTNSENDREGDIHFGEGNTEALREYIAMKSLRTGKKLIAQDSIVCLPELPPMPIPLNEWYESNEGSFLALHDLLWKRWNSRLIRQPSIS
mmetsp:Transcript_26017/g.52541  ORF Transcript_26017/g.52541 Transcript_26017/m.52541 type:complete len:400 (-) Transcript_26017:210-1409(-)